MLLNSFKLYTPRTLAEALDLYSSLEDARLLAGGTFLLNSLKLLKKRGIKTPQHIISLRKVKDLKGFSIENDCLIIKSMTVINDIFNCFTLKDNFAVLQKVCRNISTNPIRNMATIGGNLTSRYTWTELGCVLIALDATMHFIGTDQLEERISVEDFFANGAKTNKILTAISIKKDNRCKLSYQRVKKMSEVDVPLLAVCLRTTIKQGRFTNTKAVINSGIVFAKRDIILENFLNNATLNHQVAQEALNNLDVSIYDTRSDDYKKQMFRVAIKNAILELLGGENDS